MTDAFEALAAAADDPVERTRLRDQLAEANLPLVRYVATKVLANLPGAGSVSLELDDLVSYGNVGLLNAIERFDPSLGFKFSTYAVPRIRGAILDSIQQMAWAPKTVNAAVRDLTRGREALAGVLGRMPTEHELAAHLGWELDQVRFAGGAKQREKVHSIASAGAADDPDVASSAATIADSGHDEAGVAAEVCRRVAIATSWLEPGDAEVLLLHYRDHMTFRQISAQLGISRDKAAERHTAALGRLRGHLARFGGAGDDLSG